MDVSSRVSQGICLVGIAPFCPEAVEGAEGSSDGEDPQAPNGLADDEGYGHDDDAFGASEKAGGSFVSETFGAGSDVADHDGSGRMR